MICPNCGFQNGQGSSYCLNCHSILNNQPNFQTNNQNLNNNVNFNTFQTNSINNDSIKPKSKLNFKKFIPVIVVVAIVATVLGFGYFSGGKLFGKKDKAKEIAFALENEEKKYAIFNVDGEQLTEFEFDKVDFFDAGSTVVKKDGKYGIILSTGKMSVDFGEYEDISYLYNAHALYRAKSKEDNKKYIIDKKGNRLYNADDVKLSEFDLINSFTLVKNEAANKYILVNLDGKEFFNVPLTGDEKIYYSGDSEYGILSYNGKSYLLDIENGKEILNLDTNKSNYCIDKKSEDGKTIIIKLCSVTGFDKYDYKLVVDGKLIEDVNDCDSISMLGGEKLACTINNKKYLLDDNYKKSLEITHGAFSSEKNYAKENSEGNNNVDFYVDGKLVKNIPCRTLYNSGYALGGLYTLSTYGSRACGIEHGRKELYDSNGNKIVDKYFSSIETFDENGYAIVSEDGNNYYLINTKAEKVSDIYDSIYYDDGVYLVKKDNKVGYLDKKLNKLLDCVYEHGMSMTSSQDKKYVALKKDGTIMVYNLSDQKEVLKTDQEVNLKRDYIYASKDNIGQYYSYTTGKMFHELKK